MKPGPGTLLAVVLVAILAAGCSSSTGETEGGYLVSGKPALLYFYTDG